MGRYWDLRGKKLSAAIWTLSMFAIMIFGFNQAVAGGVLALESFNRQFPQMDTVDTTGHTQSHNSTIQGTVIGLHYLCGAFGALACTFLGDVFGRRKTIFCATCIQVIGTILMGTSFSFAQFIISRVFVGAGTGGIVATVSVWQSELSKASKRGEHVAAFGIFCGLGLSYALWVDLGMSFVNSSAAWRVPFLLQLTLSAPVLAFVFTLPESPRWLIKMGRVAEAREIFLLQEESEADEIPEVVDAEIRDIQISIELVGQTSLLSMFKMGPERTLHRTVIAAIVQVMLQMSGVNVISNYSTTIYLQQLNFSPIISKILAASCQAVLGFGSIGTSFVVDRVGRRVLMLTSAAMMGIFQLCVTALVSNPENKTALKAAVAFIFLYYWAYSVGFLGVPFLYASEIAPAKQRAAICGVSTAVSWLFNWLVVEVTPPAFTNIGYRYFIVYTVICFSYLPIIYFFFPETKGRELEEIDGIFAASKSIFDTVHVAKTMPKQHLSDFMQQIDERKGNVNESESPSKENQNRKMPGSNGLRTAGSESTSRVRGKAGDSDFEEVERV